MQIGLKELRETHISLRIIQNKSLHTSKNIIESTLLECNELVSIFVASIKTAKRRLRK